MPSGLNGQVILNTRPRHQQAELTALLEQDGARVVSFPVIEIELTENDAVRHRLARDIGQYDALLFVSRNAVEGAFQFIDTALLATGTTFGVIGGATRQALARWIDNLDN